MVWYLRDEHLRDLITTQEANDVMEEMFINSAAGKTISMPTVGLSMSPRGRGMSVKVGADLANGAYGYKAYPAGPADAIGRFLIVLYDAQTGFDAIVEGRLVTELRTGAIGAIGAKFLARPDASTMGIIGTSREARTQLRSTFLVRDFKKVYAFSRTKENRDAFCHEMSEELGVEVVSCESAEECVREADVITTITSASEPVLFGEWLREGTHINAIGATRPNRRELDDDAIGRADTIVVELKEGAMAEIGELIHAVEAGVITWDQVHELQDAAPGGPIQRKSAKDITISDTVGIGAEDVAMAWYCVNKAREHKIGRELDFESL